MASEFSEQLAKKLDAPAPTFLTSAVVRVIDAELQEVREVLDGLRDNDCYDACWQRWGKERGDDQFHSDACQRARVLMEKREVK
jgi:hypothetical protein